MARKINVESLQLVPSNFNAATEREKKVKMLLVPSATEKEREKQTFRPFALLLHLIYLVARVNYTVAAGRLSLLC